MNYTDRTNYGTVRMLDIECYKNLFVICLDNPQQYFFSPQELQQHLWENYNVNNPCTIVTYNGLAYDFPMLQYAYKYFMQPIKDEQTYLAIWAELKAFSDELIQNEKGFRERLGLPEGVRHIDLLPVCPVMTSLKLLGARLGCESIQDLPYPHDSVLTQEQQIEVIKYCLHDLEITRLVWEDRKGALDIRDWDKKNLSDAQMAERALVPERRGGRNSVPPDVEVFGYKFAINQGNGSPIDPGFSDQIIKGVTYQVGLGGLHSVDKPSVIDLRTVSNCVMLSVDVASYYPSMLLGPLAGVLDPDQERIYRDVRSGRVASKRRAAELSKKEKSEGLTEAEKAELIHHKQQDATYKIYLNGTFGKLGSKYSPLYNPKAMLSVTLLGQINLLKLARQLSSDPDMQIHILSANTDGIEAILPTYAIEHFRTVCKQWEVETQMELEEDQVVFVARRDVNNYFMLTASGKVKTKGIFEPSSIKKSLAFEIIYEAVMASFGVGRKGEIPPVSIRNYIAEKATLPSEFQKFLSVRTVNGGATLDPKFENRDDWELVAEKQWVAKSTGKKATRVSRPKPYEVFVGGTNIGRVIRWYIGTTGANVFTPKGGKVPLTDNAVLVQDLRNPSQIPIDLEWYIGRAEELCNALLTGSNFDEGE